MAIYGYKCSRCGYAFEIERPMSESSLPARCEKCEGMAKRTYDSSYIIKLKGDGFYSTENRKAKRPKWQG